MAWGCKHAGPCGWANREWFEWWCDLCERSGYLPGHPDQTTTPTAAGEVSSPPLSAGRYETPEKLAPADHIGIFDGPPTGGAE